MAWAGDRQPCSGPCHGGIDRRERVAGPVTRKTWVLAGAAVLAVANRHRRRGRHVQCEASDLGRTGAAGEHREGGKAGALGHGLPGWDPDLSGGTGRLAVLGDQPGQRDIHRAARARPGDLSGPGALPGERQPGGAAVRLDTCLSDPVGRGDRRRRGRAQRGSGRARLRHLGSARAQLPPSSGRPPPRPWRSSRPPWG